MFVWPRHYVGHELALHWLQPYVTIHTAQASEALQLHACISKSKTLSARLALATSAKLFVLYISTRPCHVAFEIRSAHACAGLMLVLLYGREGWFAPVLQATGFRIVFAFPGGTQPGPNAMAVYIIRGPKQHALASRVASTRPQAASSMSYGFGALFMLKVLIVLVMRQTAAVEAWLDLMQHFWDQFPKIGSSRAL